jgi:ABC-type sugar transport system permease subunit
MVYLFRYFANNALVSVFNLELGLLDNPQTNFWTILFFNLWLGFAGQTLMITSSMSSISESIEESAQVDGVNAVSELWYVTLPMIMPTVTSFVVLSVAELFVDQMSLITFYDKFSILPRLRTVGYYLFQQAYESEIIPSTSWVSNHDHGKLSYSQLSAFGVMISCIIIPLSFGMKKLLQKISPSEE